MNTRASEWETHIIGETHIRVGGQISLLIHQGENISPRAWLEISVRGEQKIRENTYLRYTGHKSVCQSVLYEVSHFLFSCVAVCDNITVVPAGCALPG